MTSAALGLSLETLQPVIVRAFPELAGGVFTTQPRGWDSFAIDVDDVYLPGEPVSVHLQALSDLDLDTLSEVTATVSVQNKATGEVLARRDVVVPIASLHIASAVMPG